MKKFILFITTAIFINFGSADCASADTRVVSTSGQIKRESDKVKYDMRVFHLKYFLEKHNSPLTPYAQEFVTYADKYNLDYRLVPAISGVESTFGKHIPKNSYNAYGWSNGKFRFNSWEQSIEIVSKTLNEKYYENGATNIYRISRRYAPPSKSWSWNVKFFMEKIDPTPVQFSL